MMYSKCFHFPRSRAFPNGEITDRIQIIEEDMYYG